MDEFLKAAVTEAEAGLAEGGIPIGSVLVHNGQIIGRGHNRRVQRTAQSSTGRWTPWRTLAGSRPPYIPEVFCTRLCHHAPCARAQFCFTASHVSWSARTSLSGARKIYYGTGA
jgi:cytosine deaminase